MKANLKAGLLRTVFAQGPLSRHAGICVLAVTLCFCVLANVLGTGVLASAIIPLYLLPDTTATTDSLSLESTGRRIDEGPGRAVDPCGPGPANTAFGAGEWFHFSVQYGFVKAGDALMQVEGIEEIDGHPCYHLVSKAESSNFFSLFFKVRDRVDSFLDKRKFVSRRFLKKTREGKHRADVGVDFDHVTGLARYSDGTQVEFPVCSQDILSAFYYVRTLKLNVGERVSVPCHADKKNYPLEVVVHRRESVKTPAGKFDCLVVEPLLKSEGIFKQKGRLTIWLTNDERKIPVLMKSKVAVGSISAILTDMHVVDAGG